MFNKQNQLAGRSGKNGIFAGLGLALLIALGGCAPEAQASPPDHSDVARPSSLAQGTLLVTGLEYGLFVGGTTHMAGVSYCSKNTTCDAYLWIHNTGSTTVTGLAPRLAAPDPHLSLQEYCPSSLSPGDSCRVRLRFTNTNYVRYYGERLLIDTQSNVNVEPSGADLPTCGAVSKCNGRGADPAAELTINGLEQRNFVGGTTHIAGVSSCPQNTPAQACPHTLQIDNTGSYAVSNLEVFLVDDDDDWFEIDHSCPSSLSPGQSCNVDLEFWNGDWIRYYGSRFVVLGDETQRDLNIEPSGGNLPTCGSVFDCGQ